MKILTMSREMLYEEGWFTLPAQSIIADDIDVQENTEDIPNNEEN